MKILLDKISPISKKVKIKVMKLIQPYREMPPVQNSGNEANDRIDAHDLFSKYTADIINEDTMFTR